jgi:mRNA interferase HigB
MGTYLSAGRQDLGGGVRVLNTALIESYMVGHARCRSALRAWLREAKAAAWTTPTDIKARYANASFLSNNRVIFDIAGNRYRLLCRIAYRSAIVRILRIGTHAEYDKWDLREEDR